jgi:hypothetical protein
VPSVDSSRGTPSVRETTLGTTHTRFVAANVIRVQGKEISQVAAMVAVRGSRLFAVPKRGGVAVSQSVPDSALEVKAHARMLEENPTPASGDTLDLHDGLTLLQSGQIVNLAVGPHADPGRLFHASGLSLDAARIAADLGRSLGVPTELILEGRQANELETSAAEVLTTTFERNEVILGLDAPFHGVEIGYPAVIDFTDATGTYYLAGEVTLVHSSGYPRISVKVRQASLVQLRRFVRVPVAISPLQMDVQAAPGQWHPVRGEIIDISLGGLGLLVDQPLLPQARFRLEFELPGRFGDLSITGRVITPPGPAEARASQRRGAGLAHRRGIAFDPLSIEDLRRLQRALYHRQVELRRLAEPSLSRRSRGGGGDYSGASARSGVAWWQFWGKR